MANAVRKEWPLLLVVDVLDMLAFDRGRTTLGAGGAGSGGICHFSFFCALDESGILVGSQGLTARLRVPANVIYDSFG
jgi:hypothetical protein